METRPSNGTLGLISLTSTEVSDHFPSLTNFESVNAVKESAGNQGLILPIRRQQPMRGVKVCRSIEHRSSPQNRRHPDCSGDNPRVIDDDLRQSRSITDNGGHGASVYGRLTDQC